MKQRHQKSRTSTKNEKIVQKANNEVIDMSFSELSGSKKNEKCANLHTVVHVRKQGQGLQHHMLVPSLPCQDQEADHVPGFKTNSVPSQQQ